MLFFNSLVIRKNVHFWMFLSKRQRAYSHYSLSKETDRNTFLHYSS
uniref:Uncharacterized protein n=1 Tax=Anguilla anguilla TaxID=7936 RepID=A0A0E9PEM5_ANGAN